MIKRLATVSVAVALAVMTPRAQQPQPQTFRGSVDLIAVDVQVIDRDGQPVAGLGPDKFDVTINGRKRRVVSADLISASSAAAAAPTLALAEPGAAPGPAPVAPLGRVVILAVDCTSFKVDVARRAMVAAKTFVQHLPASDLVGLFAYPLGPKIDPTIDHAAIVRALDTVVGQRDISPEVEFHLGPAEIVDLSAWADGLPGQGEDVALQICGRDLTDPGVQECREHLRLAVKSASLSYEGQGYASLGMLRSLMHGLAGVTGRKTVVLVSAGTVASDVPGGRPDLGDLGAQVGKAAAEANTAVYTLFIDQGLLEQFSAETRRATATPMNAARNSDVLGKWLEMFSGTAGGSLVKVLVDDGEAAYERLVREMSAYYLLGVEPAESDRTGRTYEIRVKVGQRNVTVHHRSWVVVPKPGAALAAAAPAASIPAAATPVSAPAPRPLPASVQPLTDAYALADYAGLHRLLSAAPDLANVISDFRASDSPWPASPQRTAGFALELAFAGLVSRNGFARDQGIKLLAEYVALVRQPVLNDPFECLWYWTATAGLEGLRLSDSARVLVGRALDRCPAEPRFALASAVIADQQWQVGRRMSATDVGAAADSPQGRGVLASYESAMKFPSVKDEARVRAAWCAYRMGQFDRAFELIGPGMTEEVDVRVRYFHELVKGQVLRARGEAEAAAAAFRAALVLWPGAQAARVALMTLSLARGDHQQAAQLAEAAQTAPGTEVDPWWTFDSGDFGLYPVILTQLRSRGR